MQNNDTQTSAQRSARDRVGLAIAGPNAAACVSSIISAEAAGVQQVWMTQSTPAPDTLTLFAAAAVQTKTIRLGTAIVPTYPRHPLALAQQALAIDDLAPNRLRLGIGPSHRPVMEGIYGLTMGSPLEHLQEYTSILHTGFAEGKIEHKGRYYTINGTLPRTAQIPVLVSALNEGAFRLAGEISDGAISWNCPVDYLLERSRPALQEGAAKAGRTAPPLVAHVSVALSSDRQAVLAAARKQLGRYARLPFYAKMFGQAGFPVQDGTMPDALLDNLVISGDEATVSRRIHELLAAGLDELLLMPIQVEDVKTETERVAGLIGRL
jgi:F420-dependent oxidoreductase-like protein